MKIILVFCLIFCLIPGMANAAEIKATANPGPRSYSCMITDVLNDRVILFGGGDYRLPWGRYFNDAWSLDIGMEAWKLLDIAPPLPSGRIWACAAYHPATGKMYIFGGHDGNASLNDIWELSLTPGSEHWTQLFTSGTPPAPRTSSSAVIDAVNNRLIIFGGEAGAGYDETWALNLGDLTWTQLNPAGPAPPARYGHVAVYYPPENQMIIFGGIATATYNDAWALDLTMGNESWHQLYPSGTPPGIRARHWGVYDSRNYDLVTGFGFDYPGYFLFYNDIWRLNLTSLVWQQVFPGGISVEGRRGSIAAFDPVNHRVFIFGGDHAYDYYLGDTHVLSLDTLVAIGENGTQIPPCLEIYPNPFRLPCRINIFIPGNGHAQLKVLDVAGRVVKNLIADIRYSGNYSIEWNGEAENGNSVAAGTYFIKLEIGASSNIQKVIVIE